MLTAYRVGLCARRRDDAQQVPARHVRHAFQQQTGRRPRLDLRGLLAEHLDPGDRRRALLLASTEEHDAVADTPTVPPVVLVRVMSTVRLAPGSIVPRFQVTPFPVGLPPWLADTNVPLAP